MKKVFLGGTCAESTWRDELIPLLDFDYFNPVVKDWTPECIAEEDRQKSFCGIHLFVLTSQMIGVYSIAEIVESSLVMRQKTVVNLIPDGFTEAQLKSLMAVSGMIEAYQREGFLSLTIPELAKKLNGEEII